MGLTTLVQRRLPRPTPVFDTLWYLAAERQRIFRARLTSMPGPLTNDPILQAYKFTNAYRASDRTSQYLIRNVIYDQTRPWRDTFLRVVLFKLFNKIETWETITEALGDVTADTFDEHRIANVLEKASQRGQRIYSAAYIMPSPQGFGSPRKHVNHLRLLRAMLQDRVDAQLAAMSTMRTAFDTLVRFPSIGPFLGYQLVTDLNYTTTLNYGEDQFVVPGPGALDGISKCFEDPGDLGPSEIVRWAMETQAEQFQRRDIAFEDLWSRPLQLIDSQNLFCEVDKYARAAHPEFLGRTRRTRIKQRFRPHADPVEAWYPPKWRLNERIEGWLAANTSRPPHSPSASKHFQPGAGA